jgi:hypothetical protein
MTPEERERYAEWLARAGPLLFQKKWGKALATRLRLSWSPPSHIG